MKTIREISPFGNWTGESRSIANAEAVPMGWTAAALPVGYTNGALILWDGGAWILPDTAQRAAYEATIAPPPPAVPEFVTRAQAKIALIRAGYYDAAAALIAQAGLEAQIWWNEAETFRFDSPLVEAMCEQIPIPPEEKAELFIAAQSIG